MPTWTTNPEQAMADNEDLRRKVAAILQQGNDVRRSISALMVSTARTAQAAGTGLLDLSREVIAAAAAGLAEGTAPARAARLHDVVDGIGDGMSIVAQAAQLTLQEAAGGAAAFARADLTRLADDFDALTGHFVDTVSKAVGNALPQGGAQLDALRQHTRIALQRAAPAFASAAKAARGDPLALARESLAAGTAAARSAAGALFTAVGRRLQQLGSGLSSPPPD
jgi:hypothetical protein